MSISSHWVKPSQLVPPNMGSTTQSAPPLTSAPPSLHAALSNTNVFVQPHHWGHNDTRTSDAAKGGPSSPSLKGEVRRPLQEEVAPSSDSEYKLGLDSLFGRWCEAWPAGYCPSQWCCSEAQSLPSSVTVSALGKGNRIYIILCLSQTFTNQHEELPMALHYCP